VTFHEKQISAHGWTGYGFIIIDPETGAGAYLVEGKGNGGYLMLLGIIGMISALIIFIVAGAMGAGVFALVLASLATLESLFPLLMASSLVLYLAGLSLTNEKTKFLCGGFLNIYGGLVLSALSMRFSWKKLGLGQMASDFATDIAFSDVCSP